ncbi:MAG TPA: beta-1,3-glucanase family protein [Pseudolabrys sp.]|nr:beta-1,3-glucanase family protein [Pseudolabrys sp.]
MRPRLIAAAIPLLIAAPCAHADMTVKFVNLRPDARSVPAYVSFGGSGTFTAKDLATNKALSKGVGYPLSSLTKGISIHEFSSGRIFISLGAKLTTSTAANGYSPNFDNPNLGDFTTRWDKVEITFTPGAGGANLSAQDFFGMPLKIESKGGGQKATTLTWHQKTATVMSALAKLANRAVITKANATGAVALGNNGVSVPGITTGKVVRIVSPASVTPKNAAGATVYPSFAAYIKFLRTGKAGNPVPTAIVGNNGKIGTGGPLQTYNLTATIADKSGTAGGTQVKAGDLTLIGSVNNGSGNVATTILVTSANLSDHAIYGANPSYTIPKGNNTNQIAQKVLADYFAALNFGFVGSTVKNPGDPGKTIGASPSWTWYGNRPNGVNRKPLPITDAFAFAQPKQKTYYNQYAGYLVGVTDAYGFAYNDRLQSPLAPFGNGSVMTLSILPDTQ